MQAPPPEAERRDATRSAGSRFHAGSRRRFFIGTHWTAHTAETPRGGRLARWLRWSLHAWPLLRFALVLPAREAGNTSARRRMGAATPHWLAICPKSRRKTKRASFLMTGTLEHRVPTMAGGPHFAPSRRGERALNHGRFSALRSRAHTMLKRDVFWTLRALLDERGKVIVRDGIDRRGLAPLQAPKLAAVGMRWRSP